MNSILEKSQHEVLRLAANNKAFFGLLPDCLFIVSDNCNIERMNDAAIAKFGDVMGKRCYQAIFNVDASCNTCFCSTKPNENYKGYGEVVQRNIADNSYVEYTHVPFEGYRGHQMVLIVLRDITERKLHELELEKYQNNIEKVLQDKISFLNENVKMREQLMGEVNILKKELDRQSSPDTMVGNSKSLRNLREMIYQVADSDVTVLISGESGTGKELVVDLVYKHSNRVGKPYLKFNCAAVSESLLESDLFGYEKGAFTGATSCRKGKFEMADGGTIFLDEIGDISPRMQAALLRVIQNGEVVRVGGTSPVKVDVRVIVATNVDLAKAVEEKRFRNDLYYRLNVVNLYQSPLRQRKDDIILLATHFLKKYRKSFKKDVNFLSDQVLERLLAHDWPGNIRELENAIQRAVLRCKNNVITPADLGLGSIGVACLAENSAKIIELEDNVLRQPLKKSLAALEEKIIRFALTEYNGRANEVANLLNVGKTVLYEKFKRYDINPKRFR